MLCYIGFESTYVSKKPVHNYHKANWLRFRRTIEIGISNPPLNTASDINNAIISLTNTIIEARDLVVPVLSRNPQTVQISTATLDLINLRSVYRRQWQRCANGSLRTNIKQIINRLTREINNSLRSERNGQWENKLRSLKTGCKSFWQVTKLVKNKPTNSISKIQLEGDFLPSNMARVNVLAESFAKAHKVTTNFSHPADHLIDSFAESLKGGSTFTLEENLNTSTHEIMTLISALKPYKSAGLDTVQNILLKNLPPKAMERITDIFNRCLSLAYFPTEFKRAKIIAIQKPNKDPKDPTSYRPISLLSSLGKLYERILHQRLNLIATTNNLISDKQFGFRSGHSTVHQLKRVTEHIRLNTAKRY